MPLPATIFLPFLFVHRLLRTLLLTLVKHPPTSVVCIHSLYALCVVLIIACHVFHCSEGTAPLVLATVGQAFELRFKQYLTGGS